VCVALPPSLVHHAATPPGFAPYTVTCFDTKRNLIYSTFSNLNTGLNVLAAIDPATGVVVSNVTFPSQLAYIELEYDAVTDKVYAVVEDAQQGTFFGTVEPSTGAATPVSSAAYFNTTQWNQFNTIRCAFEVPFYSSLPLRPPPPPPPRPMGTHPGSTTPGALSSCDACGARAVRGLSNPPPHHHHHPLRCFPSACPS
jgi:hypothetical protein